MKKTERKQMLQGIFVALAFAFGIFVWSSDSMITLAATKAKVVATSGKIREKADKNSEAIGSAKKGDTLEVIDSSNDSEGYTWYKVHVSGDTTGYIRGDLVSIQEEGSNGGGTTTVVGSNNKVTVEKKEETAAPTTDVAVNATDVATVKTTSDVRVRKGPGTNYDVAGSAKKGTEAEVSGIASDSGGKNWYQVSLSEGGKTIKGFIREDLVEIAAHVEAPAEPVPEAPVEEAPPAEETPVVENQDYHLQYMQNDAGNMDWYLFDNVHGTKQSLTQLLNAVEQIRQNDLAETKQVSTMRTIMIALAAVVVILIIVVTVLILKLRDAYEYEYEDDEDEEDDEDDDDDDESDEEEDEEDEKESRKPRFGFLKKKEVVEEDEEEFDEEDEEETLKEIQPPKQEKSKKPENKAWQSKDFLELDDDMEFEFLDL